MTTGRTDNALTQEYDSFKVAAVAQRDRRLRPLGHAASVGTPAIFGMNFQTVSTAQKLPTSDGLTGRLHCRPARPGPLLQRALDVRRRPGRADAARHPQHGLDRSTTIILSAKHGQSPIIPQQLRRVDDGAIITALNAAWAAAHPGAKDLVAFSVDDDGMLLWLSNRSSCALGFAKHYLLTHSAPANTVADPKGVYSTRVAVLGLPLRRDRGCCGPLRGRAGR